MSRDFLSEQHLSSLVRLWGLWECQLSVPCILLIFSFLFVFGHIRNDPRVNIVLRKRKDATTLERQVHQVYCAFSEIINTGFNGTCDQPMLSRSFITVMGCLNAGGHPFSGTLSSMTNQRGWVNICTGCSCHPRSARIALAGLNTHYNRTSPFTSTGPYQSARATWTRL